MRRFLFSLITLVLTFGMGAIRLWAQPAVDPGASGNEVGKYQVLVSSNLGKEQAQSLQNSLVNDGFTPVRMVGAGEGKFDVLIGMFDTEQEAQGLISSLRDASYIPERVKQIAATDAKAVSVAEKGKIYRVQVFELDDEARAKEAQKTLEMDDYPIVEVRKTDAGKYLVLLNPFTTREQAESQREQVVRDGYTTAKVVSFDNEVPAPPVDESGPVPLPPNSLSATEQVAVIRALELDKKVKSRNATAEETAELQKLLKEMAPPQRGVYDQTRGPAVAPIGKDAELQALDIPFQKAIQAKNFEQAQRYKLDAEIIDRNHPITQRMRDQLAQLEVKPVNQEEVKLLQMKAQTELVNLQYPKAMEFANQALQLDPNNANSKALRDQIQAEMQRVQGKGAPPGPMAGLPGKLGGQPLMLYVGGAVFAALLIIVLFLYLRTRKDKELIRQAQESTSLSLGNAAAGGTGPLYPGQESLPPMPANPNALSSSSAGFENLFGSPMPPNQEPTTAVGAGLAEPAAAMAGMEAPSQPKPPKKGSKPATESDMVMISDLFDMNKMPKAQRTAGAETGAESSMQEAETLRIPDLNLAMSDLESKPAADGESGLSPLNLPDFNIDELLKKPFPGTAPDSEDDASDQPMAKIEDIPMPPPPAPKRPVESYSPKGSPAAAPAPEEEPISEELEAVPARVVAPMPDASELEALVPRSVPEPAPTASVPAAAAAAFFEQDFEQETIGDQPAGWQGEYDYATLAVDDRSPGSNGQKYLRFEKRSGAGSANYVCHFPKASGHVIVEFDIRCDDKNKYLLGFYVEKDEDFKQSVHTIIHRVDSKSTPSLRIQGEPIPYEFGTWRHVRYDVNLLLGIVNAFVDEVPVVKEAKLATVPAYLNTLSIRDNLATTGQLCLDNIRIRRA